MGESSDVGDEVFREVFGLGEGVHEGRAHVFSITGCAEEADEAVDKRDIGGDGEDSLGDGLAEAGKVWGGRRGSKTPALILEVIQIVERHSLYYRTNSDKRVYGGASRQISQGSD